MTKKKVDVDVDVLETAKEIEVTVGLSASLPIVEYEQYKPFYSVKGIFDKAIDIDEVIHSLKHKLDEKLDADYQRALIKRIEKHRGDMSFTEIDGKFYAHVSSIINPYGIDMDQYLLSQYASRGTIVHYIAEEFLKEEIAGNEGKIVNVFEVEKLKKDVELVKNGSLNLSWEDCSFKGFWDKHHMLFDLSNAKLEERIVNDRYLYVGRADLVCKFDKVDAIVDWKTSSSYGADKTDNYFTQLAAYAKPLGCQRLVIVPLNPTNKSGFGKPIVSDEVEKYWNRFLSKRDYFRKIYGF